MPRYTATITVPIWLDVPDGTDPTEMFTTLVANTAAGNAPGLLTDKYGIVDGPDGERLPVSFGEEGYGGARIVDIEPTGEVEFPVWAMVRRAGVSDGRVGIIVKAIHRDHTTYAVAWEYDRLYVRSVYTSGEIELVDEPQPKYQPGSPVRILPDPHGLATICQSAPRWVDSMGWLYDLEHEGHRFTYYEKELDHAAGVGS